MASQLDAINLEAFTDGELSEMERRIDRERVRRDRDRIQEAQREIRLVAAKFGLRPEEILSTAPVSGRGKVPAKYRHPESESKTWSGRGRTPKWIEAWEANGRSREELRVDV